MTFDDETLMAYADGELDAGQRAAIAAALEKDPGLAARVEKHRALRAEVAGAFAGVLSQPVPERLQAAATGGGAQADARPRGNVVQFPTRGARSPGAPWRAREWMAMAASLVLGIVVSWRIFAPGGAHGAVMVASGDALVARGMLAAALDSQLAGEQRGEDAVQIGLTFRAQDGAYCRSFTLRTAQTAGLACRAGDEWRIPVTSGVASAGGGMQQAGSGIPPAVLAAIEARIAGEALDARGEQEARGAGWKPR